METGYRSKCAKQPPFGSVFQNGNCRGHSKRHLQRGMGSIHRFDRRLLPYPYTRDSQHRLRFHVAGKTYQFQALLFGIATAPLEFSRVVKEVKLVLQNREFAFTSISTTGYFVLHLFSTVRATSCVRSRTWVGNQLSKIRTKAHSQFQFSGVQVRFCQRRGFTHRKEMADFDKSHRTVAKQLDHNPQRSRVIHRGHGIARKDSSNRQTTYEAFLVVSENPLEISSVLRHENTMLRDFEKPSELVEGSQQCVDRVTSPCRGTQSFTVYRCVRQGLGCTFGKPDSKWNVVGHRDKFACKCSGIESSSFGNKVLSNPSNEQEGLGGLRQCNSSVLSQQARGDPFS